MHCKMTPFANGLVYSWLRVRFARCPITRHARGCFRRAAVDVLPVLLKISGNNDSRNVYFLYLCGRLLCLSYRGTRLVTLTIHITTMNNNTYSRAACLLVLVFSACLLGYSKPVETKYLSNVPQYITYDGAPSAFRIAAAGRAADICVSDKDWQGVRRAAADLGDDIRKVTGTAARVVTSDKAAQASIIVGTIGKSPLIDGLVKAGKLDVDSIRGRWESFVIETVDGNLVVAGSDKRGTIYGIYDISEKIGVSPWYWWADVAPRKSASLYVRKGRYVQPSPKVKYRGIFINDEWPSFGGWASSRFGGLNSKMYAHLFELLLRLKANYFWPAMWDTAFNEDDPLNPQVADMYGIVMGTSHHEPMMRAHKEYTRRRDEVGEWNYATNKARLDSFFTAGLERNKAYDNIITIGMRGDGDVAMSDGGDAENMAVLRDVVAGQRDIIKKVYGCDPSEVPQLWAIFTEVQRYYDKGFTVPDDVLLLFCDNNWGYLRRTGPAKERGRKGGMGLYYHIDMNGGPWNDRWVTTTTIPKLREQFSLAYHTGIDDLWIVNVGDLKPKEFPIDFIMRYAWNPDAIQPGDEQKYTREWAAQAFGDGCADDIAWLIDRYTKYNLLRKAEVQTPGVFSVVNHREADRMDSLWLELEEKAGSVKAKLGGDDKDAYFQLVYYPVVASSGVARMYTAATRNRLYARQGRPSANAWAALADSLFERDRRLTAYYNDTLSGGKWKNMMQDKHIGYVKWSMPDENKLPRMKRVTPEEKPSMGVSVEGNDYADNYNESLALPVFDALLNQNYYIDVFNRGAGTLRFTAKAGEPWIVLSEERRVKNEELNGNGNKTADSSCHENSSLSTLHSSLNGLNVERRIGVGIDWSKAKAGRNTATVELQGGGKTVEVAVTAVKYDVPKAEGPFFGNLSGAEFSVPAVMFSRNVAGKDVSWTVLPGLGRGEGCMGADAAWRQPDGEDTAGHAALEYQLLLPEADTVTLCIGILPVQDVQPERGLRLGVSLDGDAPTVVDARQGLVDTFGEYTPQNLAQSPNLKPLPGVETGVSLTGYGQRMRSDVFDNLRWLVVRLPVAGSGLHTLRLTMIDPEVVLERMVVNPDNARPSYFGAPEMLFGK